MNRTFQEKDFGHTNVVLHQIHTGSTPPVKERYRSLPPKMYLEIRTLLAEMFEKEVIQQSSSPWAAPIVVVWKKDSLTQASWFSTLDLVSELR